MTLPRAVWTRQHGPIPPGMVVMHSCDNPRCINLAHLTLGTQSDNQKDAARKGRHSSVQKRKVTFADAEAIRGMTIKEAMETYPLSRTAIVNIRRGLTYVNEGQTKTP